MLSKLVQRGRRLVDFCIRQRSSRSPMGRNWRVNHPNMFCFIDSLNAERIENKIFNAGHLVRHFKVPLKGSLNVRQSDDEYLVMNHIPAVALARRTFIRTDGEHKAAKRLQYLKYPPMACIPPVDMPYWTSFRLRQVPDTLYSVATPGTKAEYSVEDGLSTDSQIDPDSLSDREFKKSIQLEANRC